MKLVKHLLDAKGRHIISVTPDTLVLDAIIRVIGMISIGDLVQAIIADQQEEIEQLEHYISG